MSGPAFSYARPADVAGALAQGARPGAAFLAGGTDLIQLWKAGLAAHAELVDISRLPLAGIDLADGELAIGALARLSDVALHPRVMAEHPLIAQAIAATASGQVRNMATVGGNLLQRTRCAYFRTQGMACNKREPGSGCGAAAGETRQAALFGASAACVATHASDLAVALTALRAELTILGPDGERRIALPDLYRLPGQTPQIDTTLAPGELIAAVQVRRAAGLAARSTYLKVRDRASFEFAVVSVAAALRLEDGAVVEARLAAGGVAPLPWRLAGAEAALIGRAPDARAFAEAAGLAVEGAQPLADNGFKVELLRRAVIRALETVGATA
ncbi:xanthine dehydrogenase family protein subunit M [Phenylobacterium sp.]|uniref:FAD binding domain-containing protein n=1 Tax=Phenylobacterium sp. TaxID=1871053 RepID=UPI0025E7DEC5|nr:xanthine dehydrogenase family protein subunit M [Phenylobacterium sp.]